MSVPVSTNSDNAAAAVRKKLSGILLPLPTPFAANGELDLPGLQQNLLRWGKSQLSGYVILGSTGERVHLDEKEYVELIEYARTKVPNDLAFIIGAGQQSTRGTINEVKAALAAGADAVLVITPHFYRSAMTQEALSAHYIAVAESSSVPVILYSMPALTGIKIQPETVARLAEHPNIIAIKDSSSDVEGLNHTVDLVRGKFPNAEPRPNLNSGIADSSSRDDFLVLSGNGTVLHDALQAGADGAILAVGCVAPELCVEIFRAFKAGENEHAARLQESLTPLAEAVTTKYGIGGLKAALDFVGYAGGPVRAPLQSPSEAARSEITRLLKDAEATLSERSIASVSAVDSATSQYRER